MTVEMIAQTLRLFIKLFDEGIDVVLLPGAVQATLVQRAIKALAKYIRLAFDAVDDFFDLFVAYAIWQFDKWRRAPFTAPLPGDVVSVSQQLQVGTQRGPIALHASIERVQRHERVYARCPLEN